MWKSQTAAGPQDQGSGAAAGEGGGFLIHFNFIQFPTKGEQEGGGERRRDLLAEEGDQELDRRPAELWQESQQGGRRVAEEGEEERERGHEADKEVGGEGTKIQTHYKRCKEEKIGGRGVQI